MQFDRVKRVVVLTCYQQYSYVHMCQDLACYWRPFIAFLVTEMSYLEVFECHKPHLLPPLPCCFCCFISVMGASSFLMWLCCQPQELSSSGSWLPIVKAPTCMSQAPNFHSVMRLLILWFCFYNRLPNMQLFASALVSLTQKFSTGVEVIHMDSVSVYVQTVKPYEIVGFIKETYIYVI